MNLKNNMSKILPFNAPGAALLSNRSEELPVGEEEESTLLPVLISDHAVAFLMSEVTDEVAGQEEVTSSIKSAALALNECRPGALEYASFASMSGKKRVGVPFKVRGHIRTLNNVVPEYFRDALLDRFTMQLEDSYGNSAHTATICDERVIERVRALFPEHQIFDFLGCMIPKAVYTPAGNFRSLTYVFLLADLGAAEDPLQTVLATESEIERATELVRSLSGQHGAIVEHIRARLIEIVGIKGLDDSPLLDRSLGAIIFQALSDGYDPRRSLSHRLHTLVVGSPAVGKKLLTEAARILNPAFSEGHPGKITVAGIAGRAIYKDGAWQSHPGLIPLAHRGVFVVQDFHHVQKKKEIMGVLSMVMEDGVVIDSTAANQRHHALTAVHLDMNKNSDVYLNDLDEGATGCARLDDLGLSVNVLTRFDFIVDIPRDTERQMEIALMMHTGAQRTSRYPMTREISVAERELKVLVAYLRSACADIVIPEDIIENCIRQKQQELVDRNRDQLEVRQLLGDYQTRLSNSVHKWVFAIARSNGRSMATKEDVDEAFQFIHTKMEFLTTIEPFDVPTVWNQGPHLDKVKKRQEFIAREFLGKEVSVEEVHAAVCQRYDQQVSPRTVRRDLEDIGIAVRYGVFRIGDGQNGKMAN